MEPFALPDRYRLEGGIAAGGMAAVYAAHDTVLNRPVAVKVLADHLNDDVVARQRFAREARAAAGLSSHPGVVTIFDVGEHDGRAFLVMERRDGGTLADLGRVAPDRALRWLHTVADALDVAHEQGVVHRDIKPRNLLLDEQDRVAVADFGIASLAHETERFTQTGQVLGTAAYLAPEQALGDPATPASDRYSLAVVAYELLTGKKPFTASHFAAQARAHIEDPPPAAPGLSRDAQAVLRRGLAKDPAGRWPSAAAFVDALERALSEDPTAGTRPMVPPPDATRPMPTRTAAAAPARRRAPDSPPPSSPGRRRGPLVALAVAGLVLAVGAVVFALASGGGDDRSSRQANAKGKAKAKDTPSPDPTRTPSPEPTASPTPEPTATATPSPEPTSTPDDDSTAAGGDPSALNGTGFSRINAGDYAGAVAPLQQAVEACDGGGELDPCGYATFNLGVALNRSGRPDEAVPVLQARIDTWGDNGAKDVKQELKAARKAAG